MESFFVGEFTKGLVYDLTPPQFGMEPENTWFSKFGISVSIKDFETQKGGRSAVPIGSMGLAYSPTWMVDFYGKCR